MYLIFFLFFVSFLGIKASWEEWWTYDGISGKFNEYFLLIKICLLMILFCLIKTLFCARICTRIINSQLKVFVDKI